LGRNLKKKGTPKKGNLTGTGKKTPPKGEVLGGRGSGGDRTIFPGAMWNGSPSRARGEEPYRKVLEKIDRMSAAAASYNLSHNITD